MTDKPQRISDLPTREVSRRQQSADNKAKKLTEEQRGAVARALRKLRDELSSIKPAMAFIEEAVMERTLSSNEDLAELEEMFDILRDAAKGPAYKTHTDKAELLLLQQLDEKNLPKFSVAGAGTITDSKRKFWSMKDPEALIEFVKASGDFECFTTSVASKWCNAYFEEHGKAPPGTDYWEKTTLSFTAEKAKKGKK